LCRVNAFGPWSRREVQAALGCGATELLLPMVRTRREVETFLDLVAGRCPFGILIETEAAASEAAQFADLPLSRVYVGLNDLAIERRSPSIFSALADGTVERVRAALPATRFGLAGVTVVDGGTPVPCRLLLSEMARLDCSFSFLRRSFRRDSVGRDLGVEVATVQRTFHDLRSRPPAAVELDHEALLEVIARLDRAGEVER
jgi:hypothetical protein